MSAVSAAAPCCSAASVWQRVPVGGRDRRTLCAPFRKKAQAHGPAQDGPLFELLGELVQPGGGPVLALDYKLKMLLVTTATSCFVVRGEVVEQVLDSRGAVHRRLGLAATDWAGWQEVAGPEPARPSPPGPAPPSGG